MIICNQCEDSKPGSSFYASNRKKCKDCVRANVRENRRKNADYYREYDRARFKQDPRVVERHKAYQKTEAGKRSIRKSHLNYIKSNPAKRAAHVKLGNAVRDGKIDKPDHCEDCGSGGLIHGHHDDYAKPLEVRWLCSKCHTGWHLQNGEAKNAG